MTIRDLHKLPNVLFCIVLLGLSACGGGGGGGGSGGGTVTYSGSTNPATISTTTAAQLVVDTLGAGSESYAILASAASSSSTSKSANKAPAEKLANDLPQRLKRMFGQPAKVADNAMAQTASADRVRPMATVNQTDPCAISGTVRYSGSVNDSTGAGTVRASYSACNNGVGTLAGELTIRIDAMDINALLWTDVTFTFDGVSVSGPGITLYLAGSLRDQVNLASNTETITLSLVTRHEGSGVTSKVENLVSTYVYNNLFSPTSYTEARSGRYFDPTRGYVDVVTTTPFVFSSLSQANPSSGQMVFTGASNSRTRLTALSETLCRIELDLDGNGVYEKSVDFNWVDLGGQLTADLGDSDGDGMHNSWETNNGLNPLDASDAQLDSDGDGFSNLEEYQLGYLPNNANSFPPSADLGVQLIETFAPPTLSSTYFYSIVIQNNGPSTASDIHITNVIPANFQPANISGALCTNNGNEVDCILNLLAANESITIPLAATPVATGNNAITVRITSAATLDHNGSNNNSTLATNVVSASTNPLQILIDGALSGSTIQVPPGTYEGGISFNGKNLNLVSVSGPSATVISGGNGNNTCVEMGPDGRISGFTIRDCRAYYGGAISVSGWGSVISGNIFDSNTSFVGGFGAAIAGNYASSLIENNIFRNNTCDAQWSSGVISFVNISYPAIVNNTFVNNNCAGVNISTVIGGVQQLVVNNTFVGNSIGIRFGRINGASQYPAVNLPVYQNNLLTLNTIGIMADSGVDADNPVLASNLIYGNTTNYVGMADISGSNGNLSVDPKLVNATAGDYRLQVGSPAIDAGTAVIAQCVVQACTTSPLDGNGDGSPVIDIGAYEYAP